MHLSDFSPSARSIHHVQPRGSLEPLTLMSTTPDPSPTTPTTPQELQKWTRAKEKPSAKDMRRLTDLMKTNGSTTSTGSSQQSNLKTFSLMKPKSFPRPSRIPRIESLHEPPPAPIASIKLQRTDTPAKISPIAKLSFEEFEEIPRIGEILDMPKIFRKRSSIERVVHRMLSTSLGFKEILPSLQMYNSNWKRSAEGSISRRPAKQTHVRSAKKRAERFHGSLAKGTFKQAEYGKKVFIPPPKPMGSISKFMLKFKKEKDIPGIKEHTVEVEKVEQIQSIKSHLVNIESPSPIEPIKVQPLANTEKIPNASGG